MATEKVDLAGLQEYDKGVKNALSKKAEKEHTHDTYTTSEIDDKIQNRTGKVVTLEKNGFGTSRYAVKYARQILNEYNKGNTVLIKTSDSNNCYAVVYYINTSTINQHSDIIQTTIYVLHGLRVTMHYFNETDDDNQYTGTTTYLLSRNGHTHEIKDIKDFFIGSYEEYEAAYNAGSIPVGAFVVITDDDEEDEASSPILGVGQLDSMILG